MSKGDNIKYRKWKKKNLVLKIIRDYPNSSRSSVKTKSRLSMESVLQYINELIQEGLIYEAGTSSSTVGRKAKLLQINPSGCYFIGVKFNAIQIVGVVLNFGGNIISQKNILLEPNINSQQVIALLYECIHELLESLQDEKDLVRGIGIGVPGFVDSASGMSVRYVHIQDWEMIPLKKLIENRFGIQTYIEQSIKVSAFGLKMEPENINIRDLLYILIGRGTGMVIISNNEICSGHNNGAGEIGHMYVADNGIKCACGKYGCLETEASNRAIVEKAEQGLKLGRHPILRSLLKDRTVPTINDFTRSVVLKDPDSITIMNDVYRYLGQAVSTAVTLLNPCKIIFTGEITLIPGFMDSIRKDIEMRCPVQSIKSLAIEVIDYDELSAAKGAAQLAYFHQFNTDISLFGKEPDLKI